MKVKICGITNLDDAAMCEGLGADALGFVHFPGRSRSLLPDAISAICQSLGSRTARVLVCAPPSVEAAIDLHRRSGTDVLQSYSLEPDQLDSLRMQGVAVMRVVRPSKEEAMRFRSSVDALVYEQGIPGTGTPYDYASVPIGVCKREYIAGGLTPENVHLAKALRPYGVDVSSGVESRPGKKDPQKVEMFIRRCRT